jgi:hypothetical protein
LSRRRREPLRAFFFFFKGHFPLKREEYGKFRRGAQVATSPATPGIILAEGAVSVPSGNFLHFVASNQGTMMIHSTSALEEQGVKKFLFLLEPSGGAIRSRK